jgi:hypothetical protein
MHPRSSAGFRGREVRLEVGPFGIRKLSLVCSSHHARYPTEQSLQDPFQMVCTTTNKATVTRYPTDHRRG